MTLHYGSLLVTFLILQMNLIHGSNFSNFYSQSSDSDENSTRLKPLENHRKKRVTFDSKVNMREFEEPNESDSDFYEDNLTEEEEARTDRILFAANLKREILYDKLSLPWSVNDYLPAYLAAKNSDYKLLKLIADLNIPLNRMDRITGETPIHVAYRIGSMKIIRLLDRRVKGDIAPISTTGMTPFHVAVTQGNTKLVSWVLCKQDHSKYKIDYPNSVGETPLMTAALKGNVTIFNLLKNVAGKDYLHKNNFGQSLISLITPDNPVYEELMLSLERDLENDRNNIIKKISAEILFLLNNNIIFKSRTKALRIMNRLGVTKNEIVQCSEKDN